MNKIILFFSLCIILVYSTNLNSQVVINEIMSSNTTIIKDEFGEYDDWIELYNKSNTPFNLGGYYLTDSVGDLKKWKIKTGTIIPANGYLIFWCDEDSAQGKTNHTNFKLSSKGEMVLLVDSLKNIIDRVDYGAQITDKSYSRFPNGTGSFIIRSATYNASNGGETISIYLLQNNHWSLSPNPTKNILMVNSIDQKKQVYRIFNNAGVNVQEGELIGNSIDVSHLKNGIYYFQMDSEKKIFVIDED